MSPRSLSPQVVLAKASHMAALLDDLDGVGDVDRARLENDRMFRHALERIVTALVDLAIDINMHVVTSSSHGSVVPGDGKESFDQAGRVGLLEGDLARSLAPSVGLRNVLIHDYATLDDDMFLAGVTLARVQFRTYVQQVAAWVARA